MPKILPITYTADYVTNSLRNSYKGTEVQNGVFDDFTQNAPYQNFRQNALRGGDSSNPLFALVGNQLVLFSNHSRTESSTNLSWFVDTINDGIRDMGSSYRVKIYHLAKYAKHEETVTPAPEAVVPPTPVVENPETPIPTIDETPVEVPALNAAPDKPTTIPLSTRSTRTSTPLIASGEKIPIIEKKTQSTPKKVIQKASIASPKQPLKKTEESPEISMEQEKQIMTQALPIINELQSEGNALTKKID